MKSVQNLNKMYMDNLIVHDIRTLFPVVEKVPSFEEIIKKVQIDQYLEKTDDVYRLNLVSKKGALDEISVVTKLDDPQLKGIAWACLGGVHTFNGNYREASVAFNRALDQTVGNDVKAYIFTELTNLLRKLGYVKESITVLESALRMTENENLVWRIKTYIGFTKKYESPDAALTILNKSAKYYREKGYFFRLANVLRHIGTIYLYLNDFKMAVRYHDDAMAIAVEHSLGQYQFDVLNDKGWLLIQKKDYDNARSLFLKLIQNSLSPYPMSLALQNLGVVEYKCGNYREAIAYHSQSLQLTSRYEMRDMTFEDYYKLGLCHEKLGEIGLADHFYSAGYNELQEELDLGIKLIGYRKKLLDAYVEFLIKNQRIPRVDAKDEIFRFAMNRGLKEIRDLFHRSLLTIHLERTKNAPQLCKNLGIDTRTYFLYQNKLGLKRGSVAVKPHENPYFKQYLESLVPLSWRAANHRFEEDIFTYLLSKFQFNKKRLAEVLGVSYQQVVQKTK